MSGDAPLLLTERLELWSPRAADLDGLVAVVTPDAVRRYLGPQPPSAADQFTRLLRSAGSWSLYGYGSFVLRERGRPAIVGSCGLFHSVRGFGKGMDDVAEAGWTIALDHWGRGYAGEAMTAALAWFDAAHGLRRTVCMIEDGNDASARLAGRLGYAAYDRHTLAEDGATVTLYQRAAV